jgi:hypothetical protein
MGSGCSTVIKDGLPSMIFNCPLFVVLTGQCLHYSVCLPVFGFREYNDAVVKLDNMYEANQAQIKPT